MGLVTWMRAFGVASGLALVAGSGLAQGVGEQGPDGDAAVLPVTFEASEQADILSPEAEAFRSELARQIADHAELTRAAIEGFYASRDYRPYWTAGPGASLRALEAAVAGADAQGLPAQRYELAPGGMLPPDADVQATVAREVSATGVYLRFAGDLSGGIVTPGSVDPEINLRPVLPTAAELLARLRDEPVADVLRDAAPKAPDYQALIAEKARLEAMTGTEPLGPEIPSGPSLHAGERSPRVVALRARLEAQGYAAPSPAAEGAPIADHAEFDPALEAEVKAFQRDHGLIDDGVAGARTVDALNASVGDRLEQVLVNLERLRWMNRDLGARRIEVNIPDFSARMFDNGQVVWSSRVVVGEVSETRTPEFSGEMTYMVINPTWHIPDSIATRIYLPKLQQDPTVLSRSDMRLFTRSGTEINPKLVNFKQYTPESFPFLVKQNPNSANALGRVKFMFPNEFSIYLHDTPHRELFARDARAFSNGCIRLEKPVELADTLLQGQVDDPSAAFDTWLAAGKERHVNLANPVQVHILYRTAWAAPDGAIRYRDDIYGRDAEVMRALAAKGVERQEPGQG
jgi:L,D-transpeptidase YcbB